MNASEIISSLLDSLEDYDGAHRSAEYTGSLYRNLDQALAELKTRLTAEIADDKALSNADKRKAELQRRLNTEFGALMSEHQDAEQRKYEADCEVARLSEALKTYRATLHYLASENELEAARIAARAATSVNNPASAADVHSNGKEPRDPIEAMLAGLDDDEPF